MFALLAYTGTAGVNATNFDLTTVFDQEFTQRNGHFTFTENYRMLGTTFYGASLTRAIFSCPTWNAIGQMTSFPVIRSATTTSAQYNDLRIGYATDLPLNEEFQCLITNNLGAATEQETALLWIAPSLEWNQNLPKGRMNIKINASSSITVVANAWSGPGTLTFNQSLRGGVYSVVGASAFGATVNAFRLIFPRNKLYQGRRLRPGDVCLPNFGVNPPLYGDMQGRLWGEWGRFHTFELPQVEILGTTGGAQTINLFIDLVYLGEDLSLLGSGSTTI